MEIEIYIGELGKVAYAILLGGLIGLEREVASKPAGLRTHMLVCSAATLLVILGDVMIRFYGDSVFGKSIQTDPIRIIEAIITGISFLGAGTIIFKDKKGTVEGLTTAASILFAAGIGITVALEQYVLALALTVMVILVLYVLGFIEGWVSILRQKIGRE